MNPEIPKHLYFEEEIPEDQPRPKHYAQYTVCKLQKKTVKLFKQLILLSIIITLGLFMMNMPSDITTFAWNNSMFVPTVFVFIAAFFGWQFLNQELQWIPEIIENRYRRPYKTPDPHKRRPEPNIPVDPNIAPEPQRKPIEHPVSFGYAVTPMSTIYITIIIGCLVFLLISIWSIDVSVSAINVSKTVNPSQIQVTNGFFSRNAAINYHMALYGVIISSVLLAFICLKLMTINSKTKSVMTLKIPENPIINAPRPVVFNMISNFLAIPLVGFMVLAFILASMNANYTVFFTFNKYGEGLPELIMVTAIFVMLILNTLWSIKLFKANKNPNN